MNTPGSRDFSWYNTSTLTGRWKHQPLRTWWRSCIAELLPLRPKLRQVIYVMARALRIYEEIQKQNRSLNRQNVPDFVTFGDHLWDGKTKRSNIKHGQMWVVLIICPATQPCSHNLLPAGSSDILVVCREYEIQQPYIYAENNVKPDKGISNYFIALYWFI